MQVIENFYNHMNAAIALHKEEVRDLRRLIFRACAELETVEYENDPPARVAALMDELQAVNRASLLPPNVQIEGQPASGLSRSNVGLGRSTHEAR